MRSKKTFQSDAIRWPAFGAVLALVAAVGTAYSAYQKPVQWSDIRSLDLRAVFRSPYSDETNLYSANFAPSAYEIAIRDADERINRDFRIPDALKAHVSFWLRIYTELSSRQVVLHDSLHPEVVYEILDFRELAKTSRSRMAYEIVAERRIKKALEQYHRAFDRLSRTRKPKAKNEYERRILAATALTPHRHSIREFKSNLRSQTGQRDYIIRGLLAAEAFLPKMERIFSEFGVPAEITRLAIVESSFNPRATSRAGAMGIWQFMHKSGLEYMIIDPKHGIDERLSPLKSTVAAAKLLRRGNRMLKSWKLAITSYHNGYRGLTGLAKDPRHRKRPYEFLKLCGSARSPLGWYSKNYFPAFLAILHAETYRDLFYGAAPEIPPRPIAFRRLSAPRAGLAIAKSHNIPLHDFEFYNPDIRDLRKPLPRGFWYAVPGESDEIGDLIGKHAPLPRTRKI